MSLVSHTWTAAQRHLNFYRVHLLILSVPPFGIALSLMFCSTFTPLFLSLIFYASNGKYHIAYIDSLFNCVSAMTLTGLATVDLSLLTPWQQVVLFMQMCIGNPVFVAWWTVFLRRYYFAKKFEHIVDRSKAMGALQDGERSPEEEVKEVGSSKRLRTDMIRRVDGAPKPVDPSGLISERHSAAEEEPLPVSILSRKLTRRSSDPGNSSMFQPRQAPAVQRFETIGFGAASLHHRLRPNELERTHTVGFSVPPPARIRRRSRSRSSVANERSISSAKNNGFGGFPMPHEVVGRVLERFFPNVQRQLTRTVTIPATTTITSQRGRAGPGAATVPYISFDTVVGRNSSFPRLTPRQIEELGGVEYRALNALLWIVAGYHFALQVIGIVIVAPYMSLGRWQPALEPPALHRSLDSTWFSVFQIVSAYTNTGMSLVDTSMIPFQNAYPMIAVLGLLILAGNTAFPVFLRFLIWILTKLVPKESRANETLHFLLDHPRRCFINLFPSHQTWFLFTIVIFLNLTDWFFFMVLDIGTPAIESIPLGTRFLAGLLQAFAVRTAGFATVATSALAPAVKVLYVIMMYVSAYPIAMSVRSTNVYEEQSLGVYQDDDSGEYNFEATGSRVTVWSQYLTMHARRQLAFDMWWLGLALFLVCIIERDNLENEANFGWFNIFSIVFEVVSAYGTVGLSLGLPTANFSFSGRLQTLSKLVIILVMLRGRHRGLPVAIDRAVLFPVEFTTKDDIDVSLHARREMDDPVVEEATMPKSER